MSKCKANCAAAPKLKDHNAKAPPVDKKTNTVNAPQSTKPKTATVATSAGKSTNVFDDMLLFVELGNRIAKYAQEQSIRSRALLKSGASSESETDTTYDSDFESGADSAGSCQVGRCDLGGGNVEGSHYPPLNYNAASNLSRTPMPLWASTPNTIRGAPSINCGVACCQCPTNVSTLGGTYNAGARPPRAQRTPDLSIDVSIPADAYQQTRTGAALGTTYNRGQPTTCPVLGTSFNLGQTRSGGAGGATFNKGQPALGTTFNMGQTRSGGALGTTYTAGPTRTPPALGTTFSRGTTRTPPALGTTFSRGPTRTPPALGTTFSRGQTRTPPALGTTFNRGQPTTCPTLGTTFIAESPRSGGAAATTFKGGQTSGGDKTYDMGLSRSGTCGSPLSNADGSFNGIGGEIFGGSPPHAYSQLATAGTDAWGSPGGADAWGSPGGAFGGGGPDAFGSPGGADAWGSPGGAFGGGSGSPFSRPPGVCLFPEEADDDEWGNAEDIINAASPPQFVYQDIAFDREEGPSQYPEEWLQFESSFPARSPPHRLHCMGGFQDEHDDMCDFATQTNPPPMYTSTPRTPHSSALSHAQGFLSPYFETPGKGCC